MTRSDLGRELPKTTNYLSNALLLVLGSLNIVLLLKKALSGTA